MKRLCRLFLNITLYQSTHYVGNIFFTIGCELYVHNICRITDFVFGAVYAMGGTNFQISSNIFVCAPSGNDIYDGVNDEDTYSTDLTGLRKVN